LEVPGDSKSPTLGVGVSSSHFTQNRVATKVLALKQLLKEFKDFFAWTYKDLKGIPLELAKHKIELNIIIPLAHQARF